jgi:hypothetical protein
MAHAQGESVVTVSGRIAVQEDRRGIPELLIDIRNVPAGGGDGERLGSTVTDARGGFRLALATSGKASSRNLQLIVSAPEGPGADSSARTLYTSSVRASAAANESFIVLLPEDALHRAGGSVHRPETAASRAAVRAISGTARHAAETTRAVDGARAPSLEDPDIEAKYLFEGDGRATIVPPGPPVDPGGES